MNRTLSVFINNIQLA